MPSSCGHHPGISEAEYRERQITRMVFATDNVREDDNRPCHVDKSLRAKRKQQGAVN
jgi:hypothetical protein